MAARSRGNGTNFDWQRKSCDISTCDLSPDGNPEKYGRPMKSAIKQKKTCNKMIEHQDVHTMWPLEFHHSKFMTPYHKFVPQF